MEGIELAANDGFDDLDLRLSLALRYASGGRFS